MWIPGVHRDSYWSPRGFLVNSVDVFLAGLFLVDSTWIPPEKFPGIPHGICTPAGNPVGVQWD
jgi:hypothetical protein